MSQTATASFSPVVAADAVSYRTSTWTYTPGGTGTPVVTVNQLPPSAISDTLPNINPGDVVAVYLVDTNVVGPSAQSNTVTATDPTPPPTAVPTTPTVNAITFA